MINLICPKCHHPLQYHDNVLICNDCSSHFQLKDNIPIFTEKFEYWCNVSREKMQELIADTECTQDWLSAVYRHIPKYAAAFVPLYRADAQFLFPINSQARVLDAGSMWGGLTVPIAQFCKEIYAVDKTWETLRFLQVRAKQLGLNNIFPIVSAIHQLPFPDNYFDFIVLNGVMEWLGLKEDIILDQHWTGKRNDTAIYNKDPMIMQKEALQELYRVLKPGGGIYIAIENRLGLQYFLGHPDDHVNVRFVTLLPRGIADFVTKRKRGVDYRTYIYSPTQLRKILACLNFKNIKLFSVYPHYGKMSRLTPFSIFKNVKLIATEGYADIRIFILSLLWRKLPGFLGKYFSPSLAVMASKEIEYAHPMRLLDLLSSAGVIPQGQIDHYELILFNNRFGNYHSTNYIVYDKIQKKSVFFCKIARLKQDDSLLYQSESVVHITKLLQGSGIENTIPKLYYFGVIDGIVFQVTDYIESRNINKGFFNCFRRIDNFIRARNKWVNLIISSIKTIGRRFWLKQIDKKILAAIEWLVCFQKATKTEEFVDIRHWFEDQMQSIRLKGLHIDGMESRIHHIIQVLSLLPEKRIPIVLQHGDFDICNLLDSPAGLKIVDFEHVSKGLPFFDLANLIFSPLISEWRRNNKKMTLSAYAQRTQWNIYIKRWINHYLSLSNLPRHFIKFLPAIAVIEQHAKKYPVSRNPNDYPMFGEDSLCEMLFWEL